MLGVSSPGYGWGVWCATAPRMWPDSSTRACLARLAGPLSAPTGMGGLPGDGPAFLGSQPARSGLATLGAPRLEQLAVLLEGPAEGSSIGFSCLLCRPAERRPIRPRHASSIGQCLPLLQGAIDLTRYLG